MKLHLTSLVVGPGAGLQHAGERISSKAGAAAQVDLPQIRIQGQTPAREIQAATCESSRFKWRNPRPR